MDNFNKSIPISTGFGLSASMPLDARMLVQNTQELLNMPSVRKYTGMPVYLIDEKIQVRLEKDGSWKIDNTGFSSGSGAPTSDMGSSGDMYIDTDEGDVYFKQITDQSTLQISWVYITTIKGTKGDPGTKGSTGTRGSLWFTGESITGSDTNGLVFPSSGIENCLVKDMYLNTLTGNVYQCIIEGSPDIAQWSYMGSIVGPKGDGTYLNVGNAISGVETNIVAPDSGIDHANVGDVYMNIDTGYIYTCISEGSPDEAVWSYNGYIPTVAAVDNYGRKITGYVYNVELNDTGELTITHGNGDTDVFNIASTAQKEDIIISSENWVFNNSIYSSEVILTTDIDSKTDIIIYPIETNENILAIYENEVTANNIDVENNKITFSAITKPSIDILYTIRITKFVDGSE